MIDPAQIPDEVVWKLQDKLWRMGGASVDEVRAAIACVKLTIDCEEGHGLD